MRQHAQEQHTDSVCPKWDRTLISVNVNTMCISYQNGYCGRRPISLSLAFIVYLSSYAAGHCVSTIRSIFYL